MNGRRVAFSFALIASTMMGAVTASAEPRGVVELFTSQGCSSCPAADKLAGELAKDPSLQDEFNRRLLDPAFARSPRARLGFFYERSPYFAGQKVGIYPVGRIIDSKQLQ